MSENKKFLEGCEKLPDGRYRIRESMNAIPIKQEMKEEKHQFTFSIYSSDSFIATKSGSGKYL